MNTEPGRDSPPDRCDTAHRLCLAREEDEDTAGLGCAMEPRSRASPSGFCHTTPASCGTALTNCATHSARDAAQFDGGLSQSEDCVTQFDGGVTQSLGGATQFVGSATQFAGAVPQFEGGMSQFARAETREAWALAAEPGAVSRTSEILEPKLGRCRRPGGALVESSGA
jgi:hypothetical protein